LTGGGDHSADRTLGVNTMTGDSGSGGARGVVPAPGAGDAAAGKFLKADGTWAITPAAGGGFSPGGDLAGTSTSQTVIGLEGKPLDATTVGSPSDGQVITYNAASGKYKALAPTAGGSGTVTSIGMTVPPEFAVAPASITTSGTFAITKTTESANTVWAGPNAGGATAPTFRALVSTDIPASLALTGTPTAPTATTGTNTTQVATTAFVQAAAPAIFTPGGDLSGTATSQTVTGLQGHAIDGGPVDGDLLRYTAASAKWEPMFPGQVYKALSNIVIPDGSQLAPADLFDLTGLAPSSFCDVQAGGLLSILGQDVAPTFSPVFTGSPVVGGSPTLSGPVTITNKVASYNGIVTDGLGFPTIVTSYFNILSGAIQYWPLTVNPAPVGTYRVSVYMIEAVAGGTGALRANLTYNSYATSAYVSLDFVPQAAGGTIGTVIQGQYVFYHASATSYIQVTVLTANTGNHACSLLLERLI
jgi:hypothetical protein